MNAEDRELAARIVDQVERVCRADGITAEAEISRLLDNACPWSQADARWPMYQREATAATVRIRARVPRAGAVEVTEGLALPAELAAWAERHRVDVRPAPARSTRQREDQDGPETLDLFASGAA